MRTIRLGKYSLPLDRTLVMGILNVTPDSFSDGGLFLDLGKAVEHAVKMAEGGADIIDVGGESTRPGSDTVSEKEELRRVVPVIEKLVDKIKLPISIDTCKPKVAEECLKLGASVINDVTGFGNKQMIESAASRKAAIVIMHMKGSPKTMQQEPAYSDVVFEVKNFLKERADEAKKAGIDNIIIDPGIGFGKTKEHNLQIIRRLEEFKTLGYPILVGPSRKRFIGSITGLAASERLEGTLAAVSIAIINGANIVRVHDVKECKRACMIADAIKNST